MSYAYCNGPGHEPMTFDSDGDLLNHVDTYHPEKAQDARGALGAELPPEVSYLLGLDADQLEGLYVGTHDERARGRCLGKHHRLPESEDPCWRCRLATLWPARRRR